MGSRVRMRIPIGDIEGPFVSRLGLAPQELVTMTTPESALARAGRFSLCAQTETLRIST
jgi:hypothetical protein